MKRTALFILSALASVTISATEAFGADIYRLIDPINGGRYGKAPSDGPPFLRFGSIQQYYKIADSKYNNYLSAVNNSFASWNGAGSVHFSSSSVGLQLLTYYDSYGKYQYPYIVNPGLTYTAFSSNIIDVGNSYVELNTYHTWGVVQDLQNDKFDVETVFVHELGHVHGIAHPLTTTYSHDASAPIMAGGDNEYFWNHTARTLMTNDTNATRFLQYNAWVPSQYSTIQNALDNVFSGVTVNASSAVYSFTSHLQVNAGLRLRFMAGSTVKFASGYSLIIYGALVADGTSSSRVTFDRSGTSGTWGGIQLKAGSSGTIGYSDISHASTGINLTNSSLSRIHHTVISSCGAYGISCYASSPNLDYNTITGHTTYGVYCNNYSSPLFAETPYVYYPYPGHNVIKQNAAGLDAYWYSCPVLGDGYVAGLNCIHDNTGKELIVAYVPNTVYADRTWWNWTTYPYYDASNFETYQATIHCDLGIDHDPNCSLGKVSATGGGIVASNSLPSDRVSITQQEGASPDDELHRLFLLELTPGSGQEAIEGYVQRFRIETNTGSRWYILSRLAECFRRINDTAANSAKMDFAKFLNTEIRPGLLSEDSLYAATLEVENLYLIQMGRYAEAIANYETIRQNYSTNVELQKQALFNLGNLHSFQLADQMQGKQYFDELKSKYPDDDLTRLCKIMLGEGADTAPGPQKDKGTNAAENLPAIDDLVGNYPNPYNPTTTIRYSISENRYVTLRVYDVVGQLVATLVDGEQTAGPHEAVFDGAKLASGIYFYRLAVGDFHSVKKMLLIK
jgi:tetratricopeptide (TPR) repeat protein